ncbi:UNVERIFIED_CONTAM: hypothetical protein PYX00_001560 [Menopon gallinae]|uniref:UMP-CMP kinase n=1 Tax=Menopon gallinae TaxID=328185 RepID=A0AAW2IDT4_9NEOP
MSTDRNPFVLFVLGAPGSGKGTQCSKIVEKYRFSHLSAGDLLRLELNTPGSPFETLIEGHIKNGTIVPVEITCKLLERAMQNSDQDYFLIDGFPRNKDNLDGWEREMRDKVNLLGVLFFDCKDDVCMKRCLSRGAAGSGRSDDNVESLRKRFCTYRNDTMPIVEYYKQKKMVYVVDASSSPNDVFEKVEETMNTLVPKEIRK